MNKLKTLVAELEKHGEPSRYEGFTFVTVHPLANETELLESLKMEPSDCCVCDCYWLYSEELFFVSINHSDDTGPLISYFNKSGVENGHSFTIYTTERPITLKILIKVFRFLANWISTNQQIIERTPFETPYIVKKGEV